MAGNLEVINTSLVHVAPRGHELVESVREKTVKSHIILFRVTFSYYHHSFRAGLTGVYQQVCSIFIASHVTPRRSFRCCKM